MNWTFWTRTPPTLLDDCGTVDPLLSVYADGMADADETRRVEAHLPGCADCRTSLAWARATQRALSSRPVAVPPADLRGRIALAIAASDAAPIPAFAVRSARAFVLRPAFAAAAAASVALLGALSYGLMHRDIPAVTPPMVPSQVAVAPHVSPSPLPVKPAAVSSVKTAMRRPISHPKHADFDPALMADRTPPEAASHPAVVKTRAASKSTAQRTASITPASAPIKLAVISIKKLTPRTSTIGMMAATTASTFSSETHHPLIIRHEPRKPETIIATVPHTPTISAPALIEKTPIITPDPVPTVSVASSSNRGRFQTADMIRIPTNQIKSFTHATIARANAGIAYTARNSSTEGMAYVPGVWSPAK